MTHAPAPGWTRTDAGYLAAVVLLAVAMWLPRLRGPLDLRYDAGVYYILGTSLAEGRGYRLLNEPGAIEAIQYPPLLPAVGAVTERLAGTDDPAIVGHWLRLGSVLVYACYAGAIYVMSRRLVAPGYAALVAALSVMHSHTIFLSDFFSADVPYACLSTLFFALPAAASGLLAVGAYGLRSAGLALLAAWVGESVVRRRFPQALARGAVAVAAVGAWIGYAAHVKADPAYTHPAYAYQREGYQFYNVDYADNMAYVDPFRPELGRVSRLQALERLVTNAAGMPMSLGEGVSVHRGWWRGEVEREREVYVARADRQIGALRDTHAQDDVVGLVSHGWFGNVLLGRLLGIEHMNGAFELANTSISLLEDTEEGVPWEVTAIRINWLPHLAVDQVSDSALGGQLAAGMP